jgi:soluble lytic murein transglycosylase-like protein
MKTILNAAVLCMTLGWVALPARAQLSYVVDDDGKIIYTNDQSPRARNIASGKTSPDKPSASSDTKQNASEAHALNPLAPAQPVAPDVLHQLVTETAHKHNIDPALVSAVISTESNWNTAAISSKGALGLMQLVPQTALHFGVYNPFDPTQNVEAGVSYLSTLLERYNGDLPKALAAYNAGPSVVDRWGGVPNYRETRNYVQKVTTSYFQPGAEHHSPWRAASRPIRRTTTDDGRVVFTNE